MDLNPKFADITLEKFLVSWSLERIKKMSIEKYAHLEDHDSLCYWLEYGTRHLGAIGRISLNKFELWEIQNDKEFRDNRYKKQDGYAWNRNRGDKLDEAFKTVRRLASDIVTNSLAGNWKAIEEIPFHSIGKWKLAFLFSKKRLLPVYSMRALLAISDGLDLKFDKNAPVYALQEGILALKPNNEDVINYAYRLYDKYARGAVKPNYYIIGSKYGPNDSDPVMTQFIDNNCVAMGWVWNKNFSKLIGQDRDMVNAWVAKYHKDPKPALGKIQAYFRLFAQMKAGDIIAVKSHGNFNRLKVIGYAQVVERNGSIYFYDNELLGHHIHVEFLDVSFVKNLEYTYAGTVHQLTPRKDKDAFYDIFNWYADGVKDEDNDDDILIDEEDEDEADDETGYNEKTEGSYQRGAIASTTVKRIHNKIQNRFIRYLEQTYPDDACSGEKRYIDAKRITDKDYIIYEIKPYASAYTCIREGIGQLFDYMHKENTKKRKCIVIVGPYKPEDRDLDFINELRKVFNIPFGYLAFDEKHLTAVEY